MRSSAKYIFVVLFVAFVAWLALDTSGLLGNSPSVTRGTTIAEVNGEVITYGTYNDAVQNAEQRAQQQGGSLTLDDRRRLEQSVFDQLVSEILVNQELDRRGITVTDREIQQAALTTPPPELLQSAEFQTEGQFDPSKYARWVSSPTAKQQGVLYYLENFYRGEIPKSKLAQQIATGVYISDAQLWSIYQDQHDSAAVSYVLLPPALASDSSISVSEEEVQSYFQQHQDEFTERPGRALVSILELARPITAADTAAVVEHALELRQEIVSGQSKFEDVAQRESVDSASAANGGSLGTAGKGQFVKPFDDVAFSLPLHELSQPVKTQFGVHLIRVDDRKGDSITVSHILLPYKQSDSSAAEVDARADDLALIAESSRDSAAFDSVAKAMNLTTGQVVAIEGEYLTWNGQYVPDIGTWAFRNIRPGQTSSLVAADNAYYLARLDSITPGGKPTVDMLRDAIRERLIQQKRVEALVPRARQIAQAVVSGQSLEEAASKAGLDVEKTDMFTRVMTVPGIGRGNEAIGAAFGLPVGAVSQPITTDNGVYVIRVDRRATADRSAFEAQKEQQRTSMLERLRQARVQQFMANLRQSATIVDNRKEIMYPNTTEELEG
jgi:peptidyl-prolyl cis-trans isomerase D